jgi:CHAP domain-containing protein
VNELALVVAGLAGVALLARPRPRFASELVRAATADLGVREEGADDGPRVRAYLAAVGVDAPADWCAAAVSAWLRAAAGAALVPVPVAGSAGAKRLGEQVRGAPGATWWDGAQLRAEPSRLQRGDVVVWDRGGWRGHVGVVVEAPRGGLFRTIEGNSGPMGDRVARMRRSLADVRLVGAGRAW